jgi:hypothetical protein
VSVYRKIVFKRSNKIANLEDFNSNKINLKKFIGNPPDPVRSVVNNPKQSTNDLFEGTLEDYSECFYQPKSLDDKTLVFESRFESGNLAMASKVESELTH